MSYNKILELKGDAIGLANGRHSFLAITFCLSGDGNLLFSHEFDRNNGNYSAYVKVRKINSNGVWEQVGSNVLHSDLGWHGRPELINNVNSNYDGSIFVSSSIYGTDDGKLWEGWLQAYKLNINTNTWEKMGNEMRGQNQGDFFGWDAILNNTGNSLIVSSPQDRGGNGKVKVYNYDNSRSEWILKGNEISGLENSSLNGKGIAITNDANTIIIGSPNKNRVRIFNYENDEWVNLEIFRENDNSDRFGEQIVCNNDASLIAIASPYYGNIDNGKISIFKKTNEEYTKIQEIIGDTNINSDKGQQLGGTGQNNATTKTMDMSDDGNLLLIGSSDGWLSSDTIGGYVTLYKLNNNNNFVEVQKFTSSSVLGQGGNPYRFNYIYCSLSSDGNRIAIGDRLLYNQLGGIDIYEKQPSIEELKQEIQELNITITNKNNTITQLENDYSNVNKTLTSTQTSLTNTQVTLSNTQSNLSVKETELSNTQSRLLATQTALSITQTSLTTTQSDLSTKESELLNTQNQLTNTRNELKNTQEKLATTQSELANIENKLDIKVNEINLMRNTLNEFRNLLNY